MVRARELGVIAALAMLVMASAAGYQRFHVRDSVQASVATWIPALATRIALPKPVRLASAGDGIVPLIVPVPVMPPPAVQPIAPTQPVAPPVNTDNTYLQADAVAERVRESVPSDLWPYFDMYLYVSKAADGAWAQHMFVFHKSAHGLVFEETFAVSTGREMREKYFTTTPVGLFELDPNRFDRDHRSHVWHNAWMPWAMFLNLTVNGHLAGIALHSGIGHEDHLGHRASGGCVRMPPEKAEEYFKRFQAEERGLVPVFAFDGSSTRRDGEIERYADGQPVLTEGYRVLVIIQNYPGGPAVVAMLS